jgi:hypothetical protein
MKRLLKNITDKHWQTRPCWKWAFPSRPRINRRRRVKVSGDFYGSGVRRAADYDDIHEAILREHWTDRDIAHPDDCQYGDNDLCFV